MTFINKFLPNVLVNKNFGDMWVKFFDEKHPLDSCSGTIDIYKEDITKNFFYGSELLFDEACLWLDKQSGFDVTIETPDYISKNSSMDQVVNGHKICFITWNVHWCDVEFDVNRSSKQIFCTRCELTFTTLNNFTTTNPKHINWLDQGC